MLQGTGVALHSDAVAAEGLVPIDMSAVPVGLMSLSSNDIYGPRGVGALYMRKGVQVAPVLMGGGQERGLRSGTEDLAAIAGMAAAADIMAAEMPAEVERIRAIRDRARRARARRDPRLALNGHRHGAAAPTTRTSASKASRARRWCCRCATWASPRPPARPAAPRRWSRRTRSSRSGLLHEEAHGSLEFTFGRYSRDEEWSASWRRCPA